MSATMLKQREPEIESPQMLQEAFDRFTEASERLEARYQSLLQETEILRAELHEKDLKVKRSEKLATLGEMAAALAHEIRNPLGAMKLFVSLLKKDLGDRPDSLKLAQQIDQNIGTLDHVVMNILHFARNKPASMTPVNIESIVREQIEHFSIAHQAPLDIEINFNCSPYIVGSEHALRQVFYNLILNALQATRYVGRIEITGREGRGGELEIVLQDNGPGIPNDLIESAFDPFVTSKNEGTGLGLAIARRIVDEHGGIITVRNVGGAQFLLSLPRSKRTT